MRRWAENDLGAAADWLAGADSATRQQMADAFVGVLAATDLTAALEWCQESLDSASVPGAVGAVVRSVTAKEVRQAADLVGSLEPSPSKSKAAQEVAQKWFPAYGTLAPVPPEAVEWMGSLDRATSGHVFRFIASRWATSDRDGFAEFLVGPGAANAPDSAYATLGAALARHDPLRALDWTQRLPAARSHDATQTVFRTWHEAQPAEAIAWLESHSASQQPDAPTVRGAVEAVVTHNRADQILPKLPASLRPTARETVKHRSSHPSARRSSWSSWSRGEARLPESESPESESQTPTLLGGFGNLVGGIRESETPTSRSGGFGNPGIRESETPTSRSGGDGFARGLSLGNHRG